MRRFSIMLTILAAAAACAWAAATLEVNSDEGWCEIYLDGAKVAEIPLNGHHATVAHVAPGEHFLKITDAFDEVWYEGVINFADGDVLRAKAEPAGFTVINRGEPPRVPFAVDVPPTGEAPRVQTRVRLEYIPYKSLPTLLYVTSTPLGWPVQVDGRDAGVTPLVLTDLDPGKHVVVVGAAAAEELDLKAGMVTKFAVETQP